MDQVKRIVGSLSGRQLTTIILVAVLVAGGIYGLTQWQREAGFRPLYSNALAPEDAALVVQRLKESGVAYRLSANGTIVSVPEDKVAELRLDMAAAGLPKSGRIGFEIFDKTNLGMTDFAEHVNYRRALEGELERSVMALNEVEQARVHISFPQESVFQEARQPAKASVLLRLRGGVQLPETAIPAITHLISSAVEGLAPEAVSVLDMRGNLLNRAKQASDSGSGGSEAALEYRHSVEQDLTAKLDATLEPLVGAGRFRAAVSADTDLTSGEQSEEHFDPTQSVMVNSQKTRRYFVAVAHRRRNSRNGFEPAGPGACSRNRGRRLFPQDRKRQLPIQPHGETHGASARRDQAAVGLRADRSGSAFRRHGRAGQAGSDRADAGTHQGDSRSGRRRGGIEHRARRPVDRGKPPV